MMKHKTILILVLGMILSLTACGTRPAADVPTNPAGIGTAAAEESVSRSETDDVTVPEDTNKPEESVSRSEAESATASEDTNKSEEEVIEKSLHLYINETMVAVAWEDNDSAAALKELCEDAPLTIQMSMYGGFEQVGAIGRRLPSNDVQTTTSAGDIVLYSSNQIVIFYGSNSWAYTRLGHITDQDASGMASLLGNGNVTITIRMEGAE